MKRLARVVLTTVGIGLGIGTAPAAQAGEPFTVGEGNLPHLVAEPGGTAHVVWIRKDSGFEETHYCRVARGATTCDAKHVLPTSAFSESMDLLKAIPETPRTAAAPR